MNRNTILKSDILDIIFERRNKMYGAYPLRKFYPNRLKIALALVFFAAIAFSALAFIPKKGKVVTATIYEMPDPELKKLEDRPKEPEKKKEEIKAEKPVAKTQPVNQVKQTSNIKIVPKSEKADTIKTIRPADITGPVNITTNHPGTVLTDTVKVNPVVTTGHPSGTTRINKTTPLQGTEVDILPSYPGGMEALRKFLQKNLETPDELENGETMSVRVKFVVDHTGKLKAFETGRNDAYSAEVVRVLKKMPDWLPGKSQGESVSVYYVIPVKFERTD